MGFRFLQWLILLSKELASNFVCRTNILVQTRQLSIDEGHAQKNKIKDLVLENRRLTIRDLAYSIEILAQPNSFWKIFFVCFVSNASILDCRQNRSHWFFTTFCCPKTGFKSFRIRLIWLRATSGYSANSKDQFGNAILTWLCR